MKYGPSLRTWLPVVAWTGVIYATIPLARAIQKWVSGHFGSDAFTWIVYGVIVISLGVS